MGSAAKSREQRKADKARKYAEQATIPECRLKEEQKFQEGVPRFSIGAFLLPPVWGPAHGFWVSIIFYPLWLVADNCFAAAFAHPSALSISLAIATLVILVALTVAFSLISQPLAWHRAAEKGVSKEVYLKRERIWAVACAVAGAVLIAAATYYNLVFDPVWLR